MSAFIVVDENQTIKIVCDSRRGAEIYIKTQSKFEYELNYIEADLWTLADVLSVYKSKEVA
jgi:hypothetical protein